MFRLIIGTAVAVLLGASASGPALPRYSADQMCGKMAASTIAMGQCVRSEQVQYNLLKLHWSQIDADIKTSCIAYNDQYRSYTYTMLLNCAFPRQRARNESRSAPAFRY